MFELYYLKLPNAYCRCLCNSDQIPFSKLRLIVLYVYVHNNTPEGNTASLAMRSVSIAIRNHNCNLAPISNADPESDMIMAPILSIATTIRN
jgi:hypothetical protein